jgi:mRNA-decapping enzyme subunit 2
MTDEAANNEGSSNNAAYEDAMDDVHTRFILNLPDEELQSAPRIFFQLEQAWWFYDDFICDEAAAAEVDEGGDEDNAENEEKTGGKNNMEKKEKKKKKKKKVGEQSAESLPRFKHVRAFALAMFRLSPLLRPMMPRFDEMYDEFSEYKRSISTYGTILLNADATRVVLCRAWKSKSWTLPGGKVNQNECGRLAAARETYEETGFDPMCERGICSFLGRGGGQQGADDRETPASTPDHPLSPPRRTWGPLLDSDKLRYTESDTNKRRTAYVCRGVPEDFPFEPVARKEVSEVAWHDLTSLPKQTFAVIPFVGQLKRWIRDDNNRRRGIVVSEEEGVGVSGGGAKSRSSSVRGEAAGTPSRRRDGSRSRKPRDHNKVSSSMSADDFELTPFFSKDGGTLWDLNGNVSAATGTDEGGGGPTTNARDRQRDGSRGKKHRGGRPSASGESRASSRASSRGGASSAAGREVSATDPLVLSALASPGESNRWTEDEMFATNEQLLGRKITYDGNPHDFAEKGFEVAGEGRIDPHAFRVVGGAFMNSTMGGTLSGPPETSRLQPLLNGRHRSNSNVSGLSADGGVDFNDGVGLTPFFTDDGRAPWEENHAVGLDLARATDGDDQHVSTSHVRSATSSGKSNPKGLALLNRLRQGASAYQEVERIVPLSSTPYQDRANADTDNNIETKNVVDIVSSEMALAGSLATLDDIFMTDREITARSQKEKLATLPPSIPWEQQEAWQSPPQQLSDSHQLNDHMAWMKLWAQQLPQSRSTRIFGDFRLDVNAIMNAMSTETRG